MAGSSKVGEDGQPALDVMFFVCGQSHLLITFSINLNTVNNRLVGLQLEGNGLFGFCVIIISIFFQAHIIARGLRNERMKIKKMRRQVNELDLYSYNIYAIYVLNIFSVDSVYSE